MEDKNQEGERKGGEKKIGLRMRGSAVQPVGAAALDRQADAQCADPQPAGESSQTHGGDAERRRRSGIHQAKKKTNKQTKKRKVVRGCWFVHEA